MSMIAILFVAAAASASGQSLLCQRAAVGKEPAMEFSLAFNAKGRKIGKIILDDPQAVLDPLADVPTLKPVSKSGPLVLKQTAAPKRTPMKLTGRVVDGGYEFTANTPALQLRLKPADSTLGAYTYSFDGNRLLSGVMRMGYKGDGSCAAKAPTLGAQSK